MELRPAPFRAKEGPAFGLAFSALASGLLSSELNSATSFDSRVREIGDFALS